MMHVAAPTPPSCSRKLLITVLIFSATLPRHVKKKQIIFCSAAFPQAFDSIFTCLRKKGVKELAFFQGKKGCFTVANKNWFTRSKISPFNHYLIPGMAI